MSTAPELTAANAAPLLIREHPAQGVLRLVLNRPRQFNALSSALMAELQAGLDAARADATVRVVIIAAQGPGFSSGHDLKEIRKLTGHAAKEALFRQCSVLMQSIVTLPKPIIAEVQGIAAAAGCQLAASCDLAIASDQASFATPGVNIGLFCSTPMVALSRAVGRKPAMEMLLLGDPIPAARAEAIGLINRVVPAAELSAAALGWARQIASKSALTLKTGKAAFYRQLEMPLADAYDYATRVMAENLLARDAEEGIDAFIEKRTPEWDDR